jgi:hypothetical protein
LNIASSIVLFGVLGAGCGEEVVPTPADDGCEHMIEGPSAELSAIGDIYAEAPDMLEHHVRYDVTLAGDAAPYSGYVDLVMDEPGEFVIFVSQLVPLNVFDSNGEDLPPEAIDVDVEACAEVSAGYTFDFGVGTYRLSLGPSEDPLVQVVVVYAGGELHE